MVDTMDRLTYVYIFLPLSNFKNKFIDKRKMYGYIEVKNV